jgi:hypothetical protein
MVQPFARRKKCRIEKSKKKKTELPATRSHPGKKADSRLGHGAATFTTHSRRRRRASGRIRSGRAGGGGGAAEGLRAEARRRKTWKAHVFVRSALMLKKGRTTFDYNFWLKLSAKTAGYDFRLQLSAKTFQRGDWSYWSQNKVLK